jgi:hypothetical protein
LGWAGVLFWAIIIGTIVWADKAEAMLAVRVVSQHQTHLGLTPSFQIEAIDILNFYKIENTSLKGSSLVDEFTRNFARLQLKMEFGADHAGNISKFPFCQRIWVKGPLSIVCHSRGVWAIVSHRNLARGHVAAVEDHNAHREKIQVVWSRIESEAWKVKIYEGSVSKARSFIRLEQYPSLEHGAAKNQGSKEGQYFVSFAPNEFEEFSGRPPYDSQSAAYHLAKFRAQIAFRRDFLLLPIGFMVVLGGMFQGRPLMFVCGVAPCVSGEITVAVRFICAGKSFQVGDSWLACVIVSG